MHFITEQKNYEDMPPSEIEKPYMYATDENGNPWSPGWITLISRLSYNFTKWIVINAGVENILDHTLQAIFIRNCCTGRNFIISLRVIVYKI